MGGCLSADTYGPDIRRGSNAPLRPVARAHGSQSGASPVRRKTRNPTFRFNQTLKRAVPRRATTTGVATALAPHAGRAPARTAAAPPSTTTIGVHAMMDDDIDDLIGGRETNFYERGSFTSVGPAASGPLASPRRDAPTPPPRRRATDRAPVRRAHSSDAESEDRQSDASRERQRARHSNGRRRQHRAHEDVTSSGESESEERPPRRKEQQQQRKSSSRRRDEASSSSLRRSDPVLRKLTGQARYNSDGPMGKSWDRVQAVIQRRSQERGGKNNARA